MILWRFIEKSDFKGGHGKLIHRANYLKRGRDVDSKGGLAKKRGMVFLRRVIPQCTLYKVSGFIYIQFYPISQHYPK